MQKVLSVPITKSQLVLASATSLGSIYTQQFYPPLFYGFHDNSAHLSQNNSMILYRATGSVTF